MPESDDLARTVDPRQAIVLELGADEGEDGHLQPLAGIGLWSSRPLHAGAAPALRPRRHALDAEGPWEVVFDGEGVDGGRLRRLRVERDGAGNRRIRFDDGETYLVAPDGRSIVRRAVAPVDGEVVERALGAPMALALAARGIHLLHASAIARDGRAIAVSAPSGGGKSTLAAAAAAAEASGWHRIADDILPVRLAEEPVALPHFPQLKLTAGEQYPAGAAAAVPLAAIVELERRGAADAPELERLPPAEGALALARAGVAVRLFDGELLERHLAACAAAAGRRIVARLRVPDDLSRLGEAVSRLADLFC